MTDRTSIRDAAADLHHVVRSYRATFGRPPNLTHPSTFNERIAWKKLNDRNELLRQLADKVAVRDYVADRIGVAYLPAVFLITDDPDQIDFTSLPNRFVVKATHGSGCVLVVDDMSCLDPRRVVELCHEWLDIDFYAVGREWCYKDLPRRILVEERLAAADGAIPPDLKLFCFGGVPRFIQVDVDRSTDHRRNLYDTAWQRLPCAWHVDNFDWPMVPPSTLEDMLRIAAALSAGLDFVRVDLYSPENRVVFGEMTNYPGNGLQRFHPEEYDRVFGAAWPPLSSVDTVED